MTEKQKDSSSSAKSMEKTSLLDLDIGKDFLTSWKSVSVTEDDPMDFDFSKITEGNKQAFKFDNLDMDFNLDNDFGKISSFKVDILDLDVSSPVKKSAKPNEKSEVSTEGKSNQSTFQFDFNEFNDLSFSPSLMKKAKQTNANQDAKLLSSPNRSLGLKETFGASEGETTSKFDSQFCAEPDSRSKEKLQTPLVEVHIPSKSEISKDQATNVGATTSPQKPISDRTQQTFQDNCPKEIITSVEPYAKDKCWNSSVRFVSENSSTQHTASNSQEEVDCLAGKERTNTGREQSLFHDKTDLGVDCGGLQIDELSVDMAGSQSNDGETSQFSGDNPVRVDSKCNSEPGQGDSQFEQTSASASKQVLRETEAVWETMDLTSELVKQSNSETTGGGRVILDPKHVNEVVRSKYFKGSDGAKSQMEQSSLSQTKIATFDTERIEAVHISCADIGAIMDTKALPDEESLPNIRSESFKGLDDTKSHPRQESISQLKVGAIGSQRITTWQPCTADERKLDNKNAPSGNKFVALPKARSLPREQTKGDSIYVGSQGSPSNQTSNRPGFILGGFDSYDARRTLTNTSRLHDMDVAKGEPVLNGTENNVKDLYTLRYAIIKNGRSPGGRKLHSKDAHSGSKPIVFPKAIPREQIEEDSVRTRNEGSIKELTSNSSHVETSSSNEQTYRPASLLRLNPKLQVSGMKSTQNKINSPDNKEVSHLKDGIRVSVISNLSQMRTTETIHPSSKSTLQKDTTLLTNSGQCADLKEDTGPRMAYHADTREEAPLSPTLKRKKIEESSANLVLIKPTKRLFVSPGGKRNFKVLSEKLVNKQDLPYINTEKVLNNSQSPCLNSPHKLETPFEMDNDTNVERAEACAKELDNLVNMLKKKHEEAKEILVRAFVTNNKLLMLNHTIYDEKFRMMEKFGALWLSK